VPELTEQHTFVGSYALWFVRGSWWAIGLDQDGDEVTVFPSAPPLLPPPCLN
jgi:hypothetical protein